jgi:hypothetical protein
MGDGRSQFVTSYADELVFTVVERFYLFVQFRIVNGDGGL